MKMIHVVKYIFSYTALMTGVLISLTLYYVRLSIEQFRLQLIEPFSTVGGAFINVIKLFMNTHFAYTLIHHLDDRCTHFTHYMYVSL